MDDSDFVTDSVGGFALIGRSRRCGCVKAIDLSASPEGAADMERAGLLLEYQSPGMAKTLWDAAVFPCPHSRSIDPEPVPQTPSSAPACAIPFLRVLEPPQALGPDKSQQAGLEI